MRLFEDQSIMITDLIEDDLKKLASHKNILRDIPFIGSIFESPDYLNNQSELAIIITPSITSSKEE
jgi:Flp pilus assembly secretin CpaC